MWGNIAIGLVVCLVNTRGGKYRGGKHAKESEEKSSDGSWKCQSSWVADLYCRRRSMV